MVKSSDHDGHKDWGYDEKYQLGGKNRGKSRYMDPYDTSYPHMGFNRDGEHGGFQDCEGNNTNDSRGFQAYEDHERQSCIGESIPTGTRNFYGDNQEFQGYHDRRKRYDERKKPEKYGKDQLDGKSRGKSIDRECHGACASYPPIGFNRDKEHGGFQDSEGNNTNSSRGFPAYENRGQKSKMDECIPMTNRTEKFYRNNQGFQANCERNGNTVDTWISGCGQSSDMGQNTPPTDVKSIRRRDYGTTCQGRLFSRQVDIINRVARGLDDAAQDRTKHRTMVNMAESLAATPRNKFQTVPASDDPDHKSQSISAAKINLDDRELEDAAPDRTEHKGMTKVNVTESRAATPRNKFQIAQASDNPDHKIQIISAAKINLDDSDSEKTPAEKSSSPQDSADDYSSVSTTRVKSCTPTLTELENSVHCDCRLDKVLRVALDYALPEELA